MAWPPVFGNFSVHTYTDACKCTWRKGKKTGMICPVNHDSYIRTKHLEATHLSLSAQHLRTLSPTSSGQHKHCKRVCNESLTVWKKSLKVLRKQSCVTTAAGFPVWHSTNWAIPPRPRKIVEAIKCGTHRNSSTEFSNKKIPVLSGETADSGGGSLPDKMKVVHRHWKNENKTLIKFQHSYLHNTQKLLFS